MELVQGWSTDRTDSVETVTRRLIPFVTGRTIAPMFFRVAGGLVTFGVHAAISQGDWRRLREQQRRSGALGPARTLSGPRSETRRRP